MLSSILYNKIYSIEELIIYGLNSPVVSTRGSYVRTLVLERKAIYKELGLKAPSLPDRVKWAHKKFKKLSKKTETPMPATVIEFSVKKHKRKK